jgi:RNA binding exosome subunit
MYISGFDEAFHRELDDRLDDAINYNGRIFDITIDLDRKEGSYGNIIKYIDEEVKTIDDVKEVLKAFIQGLNRET